MIKTRTISFKTFLYPQAVRHLNRQMHYFMSPCLFISCVFIIYSPFIYLRIYLHVYTT